jgi:ribose transport system substrate-binding protein
MHTKRLLLGAVAVAGIALLSACSTLPSNGSPSSKSGKASYAYLNPNTGNSFHISVQCGAVAEAKKLGISMSLAGGTEFNATTQIPILQAVAAKNPSAIITAATDSKALAAPLQQSKSAGSKIVLFDSGLTDASIPDAFVGSDNEGGGKMLADVVGKQLGGKGLVLPLDLSPGVPSTNDRATGFIKEITAKFPGITLLDTQYDNYTPATNAQIVSATLSAHPDLTAIVPTYNDAAIAALSTLDQSSQGKAVKVFTFDADPKIVADVKAGTIQAVASQQVKKIGARAVDAAVAAVTGKSVDKTTSIPMVIVTKDNVDDATVADEAFYVTKACN